MTKKIIKVKKNNDNSDISITIENNLNANNKQINNNNPQIKKRRRKKVIKKDDEINDKGLKPQQPLMPLKDTSYLKPGPVGAFKIWRDTMDSYNTTVPMDVPMNQAQQLGLVPPRLPAPEPTLALPAPPAQSALPAPPAAETPLTLENWKRAMTMMREQPPPSSWSRNLIDDDDDGPIMPTSPAFSRMSKQNDLEFDLVFANELENSIAEVYGTDANDPETKETGKEIQKILNKARTGTEVIQAKKMGTTHANLKWAPTGQYKDTEAYQISYNTALNKASSQKEASHQGGKTRGQKKVESGVTDRSRQRERERLKRELEELNKQMPDFGDFEIWNEEEELAKVVGLTRIEEF
jgi:hypothetical protein